MTVVILFLLSNPDIKHLMNDQHPYTVTVVLDGTFHLRRFRQLVEDFTSAYDCRLFCIEVTADEDAIRQRTAKPRPNSEADYNVYKLLKQQYEPLQKPHLQLNSSKQSIDQMIQTARDYLLQ